MKYNPVADTKMRERRSVSFNCFRNYKNNTNLAWILVMFVILGSFMVQSKATKPNIKVNNRPIIGILAQESTDLREMFPNGNYTSYIAASYVKGVEAAGARVVPIMIGRDRDYYIDIMMKLNGVLLPGGNANLSRSAVDGYADAGERIYEIATELNDAGDYFPVFGICLGFEYLVILAAGRGDKDDLVSCNCHDNLPIEFTSDFRGSKLFRGASDDIVDVLATEPVTVHHHDFCVLDDNLTTRNLTEDWRVTSYGDNKHGIHFMASIESTKYPYYGVQFHPERSIYEWPKSRHYPSSKQAVMVNRYFYDFFVDECRKNFHSIPSVAEENANLIYNYELHYTGFGGYYEQCYGFEPMGTSS